MMMDLHPQLIMQVSRRMFVRGLRSDSYAIKSRSLLQQLHSEWESTSRMFDLSFTWIFQKPSKGITKKPDVRVATVYQAIVFCFTHMATSANMISLFNKLMTIANAHSPRKNFRK